MMQLVVDYFIYTGLYTERVNLKDTRKINEDVTK